MSKDEKDQERFFLLASLYLDAQTNADQSAELAELLRNSDELRREFTRMMRVHGALTQRGSLSYDRRARTNSPASPVQARRGRHRARSRPSRLSRLLPLGLAAAFFLIVGLFWALNSKSSDPKREPIANQSQTSEQKPTQTSRSEKAESLPVPSIKEAPKKDEPKEEKPKLDNHDPMPKIEEIPKKEPIEAPKKPFPPKSTEPDNATPEETTPKKQPRSVEKQALGFMCQVIRVIGGAKRDGQAIKVGATLKVSTQLTTDADSFLTLSYSDGSLCELGPKSQADLKSGSFARFNLAEGTAFLNIRRQSKKSPFQLETPHSQIKVLGTQFQLTVSEQSTRLDAREGKVRITRKSDGKSLIARARDRVEIGPRVFRKRKLAKKKRPRPQILLQENFEKLKVNKWPKSFRGKTPESSKFVTTLGDKNKFMTCPGSNQIQRAYLPFDKFQLPFSIQFRIRLTGEENSRIGLNLWNETDNKRYAIAYDKQAGLFKVYRGKAGLPLASLPAQLAVGEWHQLSIMITKKSVKINVAGRSVLFAKSPVSLEISSVALVSLGKDSAEFDDILYSRSPAK